MSPTASSRALLVASLAALFVAAAGAAQRLASARPRDEPPVANAAYDGRFTFARLRYTTGPGGYYYGGLPAWAHGYWSLRGGGRAEDLMTKILHEISLLDARVGESVVLSLDDPQLGRFPVAYMTEAGYWVLTDREAAALGAYLRKGGFVIFDDFRDPPRGGGGWDHFAENMRRVIPGAQFLEMDPSSLVFHSFFEINTFDIIPQSYDQGRPLIRGLFEDNDPAKRLIAIANFNTDVSDFWEFSATGFRPIDESNEAYKLGVNYIMYALTH